MIVGSKCQSKTFYLQIHREFALAKNMQTSKIAEEFYTVNDTAISPQDDGCTEVKVRPFIVFL